MRVRKIQTWVASRCQMAGEAEKTLHVYFLAHLPDARAVDDLGIERFAAGFDLVRTGLHPA